ncbi:phage antirepressor KilAC domain-containing protein [Hominenteromicrobium sp.]|jgi:phage antirepressor YoqD-like protein|uniref:phage antirepressor KilAC domain-containing protein n=1 Tax=Hominenteromicrobium sp. TaxID=3073581 RepID=UPI002055CBB3|nr:MAG TPA: KilAC domain protein [Bacteriophage sp.]
MSDIITISGVSCYEKDGTAYLNLEAVARGLGFTTVATSGNEVVRWKRVEQYLAELGFATCGERPNFIPENIFYRLAMKAKNEAAERFQAKIADDVIPSIRKHGMYATPDTVEKMIADPDSMIKVLTALKEEREHRQALAEKIETDRPATVLGYAISTADDDILIRDLAKIIRQNGVDIGEKRLFEILRKDGYLCKSGSDKNMPTQRSMDLELFRIKETVHTSATGSFTARTPKVTGKGQKYFVDKFLGGARNDT